MSGLLASRTDSALVIIDIQERLAAAMDRRDEVIARTRLLATACALVGAPIVVTRQNPNGLGETDALLRRHLDALSDTGASITTIGKMHFDCFAEPTFVDAIQATGRRQLVVAGMEAHICVTQTALDAHERGYNVQVVADACCSRDARAHEIALSRIGFAGAQVTTAESVAYELVERAGTDEFRALLAAVKG